MSKTLELNDTSISIGAFTNKRPIQLELKEIEGSLVIIPSNLPSEVNLREFFNSLNE